MQACLSRHHVATLDAVSGSCRKHEILGQSRLVAARKPKNPLEKRCLGLVGGLS
jgi:hypothetical protein